MTEAIRAWRKAHKCPPTQDELTEAYAMNAQYDKARAAQRKAIFGFNPPKRWTSAQRKRAMGVM